MKVTVTPIKPEDRADWETMCYGYAEFYQVPMNAEILDTVKPEDRVSSRLYMTR